jgi:hypothetical protein
MAILLKETRLDTLNRGYGLIGPQDRILVVKKHWLELILGGQKTLEIRRYPCHSLLGKRIWLCMSGSSAVYGSALIRSTSDALSQEKWVELRYAHLVDGDRMYARSFAWELVDVETLARPVNICRKKGSIDIQIGPGR